MSTIRYSTPRPFGLPPMEAATLAVLTVPSDEQCHAWWDEFGMPSHIREHSRLVAEVATAMALRAADIGLAASPQMVRACGLLHDLAKDYTIRYGGSHAQIGGAWVMELTGNPLIAMGVFHHVHWPFENDPERWFLPMAVIYADKRVRHDDVVTMRERFQDLIERYGRTEEIREKIRINLEGSLHLEAILNDYLKVDLNACTFDSGRLVQRA